MIKKVIEESMFQRLHPSTVRGEAISVQLTYSSFDKNVIDALEKQFNEKIGIIKHREIEVIVDD